MSKAKGQTVAEIEDVSRETGTNPHPGPLPQGEGSGGGEGTRTPEEGTRWPVLGRYVALVTLDRYGVFVLPGETVELDAHTAHVLLELGLVEIWPGRGLDTPLRAAATRPADAATRPADADAPSGGVPNRPADAVALPADVADRPTEQ